MVLNLLGCGYRLLDMQEAYILLNCERGSEGQLLKTLSGFEGVKELRGVFGAYDILVKLELPLAEMLNETVRTKIRNLQKISGSLILLTNEGQTII
jgi:hypothetical protein